MFWENKQVVDRIKPYVLISIVHIDTFGLCYWVTVAVMYHTT